LRGWIVAQQIQRPDGNCVINPDAVKPTAARPAYARAISVPHNFYGFYTAIVIISSLDLRRKN
jgi:hypothetical protein